MLLLTVAPATARSKYEFAVVGLFVARYSSQSANMISMQSNGEYPCTYCIHPRSSERGQSRKNSVASFVLVVRDVHFPKPVA